MHELSACINHWMLPREAKMTFDWTDPLRSKVHIALVNPLDWLLRYIRSYLFFVILISLKLIYV